MSTTEVAQALAEITAYQWGMVTTASAPSSGARASHFPGLALYGG